MLTIEAEYLALSTSYKELLTLIRFTKGAVMVTGLETKEVDLIRIPIN